MSTRPFELIGLACLAIGLPACRSTALRLDSLPAHEARVIWQADTKLGGCAVGDIYVERPGLEIAVVSGAGELWLLSRGPNGWEAELALQTPGELIQVAVGDLLTNRPGEEILAGGIAKGTEDDPGPGATWLVARQLGGAGFEGIQVLSPSALTHAVLIADLDPARPGLEGLSAGFDRQVTLLAPEALDQCPSRVIANLPSDAKGLATFDGGLAVACAGGELFWVGPGERGYQTKILARTDSGLARLASGPEGLLASTNNGSFYYFSLDSTGQALRRYLHTESGGQKGRGAAWADLGLPSGRYQSGTKQGGRAAVTAGYSGEVTAVLAQDPTNCVSFRLHRDDAPLHHLAAGDLVPETPGDELVAVGYSGRVVLIARKQ
jgi:hypothetical protein